ncbi:LicD family protein [Candidatus Hepatincola sp. Av]
MLFNKSEKNVPIVENNKREAPDTLERIKSELAQLNKVKHEVAEINAKLNKFNEFFSYMFNIEHMQETTGILKLFQVSCLKLACNFTDFLQEHNITDYWLDFQSLLGSYRNEKFAPWDDTITFSITKESFHKLLELLEQNQYAIEFNLYKAEFMVISAGSRGNIVYNLVLRNEKKIIAIISLFIYEERTFANTEELNEYKQSVRNPALYGRANDKVLFGYQDMQFASIMRRLKDNRRMFSVPLRRKKEEAPAQEVTTTSHEHQINLTNPNGIYNKPETYYVLWQEHTANQPLLIKKTDLFPLTKVNFASYRFNAPSQVAQHLGNIYNSFALNPYNLKEGRLFNTDNLSSIIAEDDILLQFITKK